MATTTNFGWETPDDTDLVKDGAAAIRTALGGVDTSFVDLKGGTTGQVLAKASATDLDFSWVTDATGIPATIFDAKGDIIAATGADTASRLAVGTNGQALVADSTTATGLKWGSVASGLTLISRTSFSSQATQSFSGVFTSGYGSYRVIIESLYSSDPAGNLQMLMRDSGGQITADYAWSRVDTYTGSTYNYNSSSTSFIIAPGAGRSSDRSAGTYDIMDAGAGNIRPHILGRHTCADDPSWRNTIFGGTINNNSVTYTGFDLKSSLGNLTGTVSIYGLAL